MPSSSKSQADFMRAVAHSPEFAKKAGVPQSVGKEFSNADKGRKFSKGGDMKDSKMNAGFMAMMAKKKGAPAKKMAAPAKKMASGGMTKMGSVKTAAPSRDGLAVKGKTKAMKSGGRTC
jgi:hypothetical protein